jgi:hypothetical protein
MKFKFTSQDKLWGDELGTLRTVEFEQECLEDIITEFELFLKGSGFVFDNISLDVEDEDEYQSSTRSLFDIDEEHDNEKEEEPLSDLSSQEKIEAYKHTPEFYGYIRTKVVN